MKEICKDELNPFSAYEIEHGTPFPVIAAGMKEIAINLAYLKPDGSTEDAPSFLFIMQDAQRNRYYTQVSLRTFEPLFKRATEIKILNESKSENQDNPGN